VVQKHWVYTVAAEGRRIHLHKHRFLFLAFNRLLCSWEDESGWWTKRIKNGNRLQIEKCYVVITFMNQLE